MIKKLKREVKKFIDSISKEERIRNSALSGKINFLEENLGRWDGTYIPHNGLDMRGYLDLSSMNHIN